MLLITPVREYQMLEQRERRDTLAPGTGIPDRSGPPRRIDTRHVTRYSPE